MRLIRAGQWVAVSGYRRYIPIEPAATDTIPTTARPQCSGGCGSLPAQPTEATAMRSVSGPPRQPLFYEGDLSA